MREENLKQLTAAIDYESFYRRRPAPAVSIQAQGVAGYLRHPEFDAYLVSVVTEDGYEFVGHPSEFDFTSLADYRWLSHNKGFDQTLHEFLIEQGVVSDFMPEHWSCTADLAAYHCIARSLNVVVNFLFGIEVDKTIRDWMNNKRWDSLSPEEKDNVREYALEDSRHLPKIWRELAPTWPESEEEMSEITYRMKNRGLPVNDVKLDESIKMLNKVLFDTGEKLPWWAGDDPACKNKTPLSNNFLAAQCRKDGIDVPESRAKGDPEAIQWTEKYGDDYGYVGNMQTWASCNVLVDKLHTVRDRLRIRTDGYGKEVAWMPYGLKYAGTHTQRDSGGDGFNVLNMNRDEVHGVDLRGHFEAPKGYKFLSADFSQIEPRVLAWLVEDEEFLERVRGGEDPYITFGLVTLGHEGEWTSHDRKVWKMMVLQLGYQSGAPKFQSAAKSMGGLDLTLDECKRLVKLYRRKNKLVAGKKDGIWAVLQRECRKHSVSRGGSGEFVVELPSGRKQYYRNVTGNSNLTAVVAGESGFSAKHLYGGLLTENTVQAIARDIFTDKAIQLERAGISSVLRIYDEFLALVKTKDAKRLAGEMERIMCEPLSWAPGLPILSEVSIVDRYFKD